MTSVARPKYLPYIIGFVLSLIFTVNAYFAVVQSGGDRSTAIIALLVGLAVGQMIVQVVFFLHLGREPKPRWNLLAFLLMIMVVAFIVVGSLWIMNNLNYNMMGDHAAELIIEDEGIHR